jgi:ADP-ribose pyrophosphatase YjhB (NUDIX family)
MHRLTGKILRPIWRMTRGLTLGAQGVVIDDQGRVLLVRHGYRPGWHFPGGGVEWNETIIDALGRELQEETGVEIDGMPQLHGIFTNFTNFPGDHIAVFVVCNWHQPLIPEPNKEIREQKFVSGDNLPEELVPGARNRLKEIFDGMALSKTWV